MLKKSVRLSDEVGAVQTTLAPGQYLESIVPGANTAEAEAAAARAEASQQQQQHQQYTGRAAGPSAAAPKAPAVVRTLAELSPEVATRFVDAMAAVLKTQPIMTMEFLR